MDYGWWSQAVLANEFIDGNATAFHASLLQNVQKRYQWFIPLRTERVVELTVSFFARAQAHLEGRESFSCVRGGRVAPPAECPGYILFEPGATRVVQAYR
jgi:hypothetical protein